jgi:hypothetical protein
VSWEGKQCWPEIRIFEEFGWWSSKHFRFWISNPWWCYSRESQHGNRGEKKYEAGSKISLVSRSDYKVG